VWLCVRSQLPFASGATAACLSEFIAALTHTQLSEALGLVSAQRNARAGFLAGFAAGLKQSAQHHAAIHDWWLAQQDAQANKAGAHSPCGVPEFLACVVTELSRLREAAGGFIHDNPSTKYKSSDFPGSAAELEASNGHLQQNITSLFAEIDRAGLLRDVASPLKALLLSRSAPRAASFLSALPSSRTLHLGPDDMRFGLRNWLMLPLSNDPIPAECESEAAEVAPDGDRYTIHRFLIRKVKDMYPRHNRGINVIQDALSAAGVRSTREVPVASGLVGDISEHQRDPRGRRTVYDFTVVSVDVAGDIGKSASTTQGAALEHARKLKIAKYNQACQQSNMVFVPLPMEESGNMGKELFELFRFCGEREHDFPEAVPEFTTWATPDHMSFWTQNLSCSVVRGQREIHAEAVRKYLHANGR